MKKELEEKLFKKYPKIFKQKDLSPRKTLICFGFECGDGWYWLIDNLCSCIQNYIDANDRPQIEVTQIKEKYGTLSFYYIGGNDMVDGMVWLAEEMSGTICETCGTTKNVTQTKGWIKTICKKCLEENK